jgi:hypothetical protein
MLMNTGRKLLHVSWLATFRLELARRSLNHDFPRKIVPRGLTGEQPDQINQPWLDVQGDRRAGWRV